MTAVGPGKQPGPVGDMSGCMSAIGGNVFMGKSTRFVPTSTPSRIAIPQQLFRSASVKCPSRRCLRTRASLLPVFPYFEICKVAGMTNLLVSNKMVGKGLAERPGDKPVALMRGRGDVVVGASIPIVTSAPSTRRLRLGCSKPLG